MGAVVPSVFMLPADPTLRLSIKAKARSARIFGVLGGPLDLAPGETANVAALNFLGMNLGWVRV